MLNVGAVEMEGDSDGLELGLPVGLTEGVAEGSSLGALEGILEGKADGELEISKFDRESISSEEFTINVILISSIKPCKYYLDGTSVGALDGTDDSDGEYDGNSVDVEGCEERLGWLDTEGLLLGLEVG